MFQRLLGKTFEAYIDDVVIKSKKASDYVKNSKEMFQVFKRYNIKLNPMKCAFGVSLRKFL